MRSVFALLLGVFVAPIAGVLVRAESDSTCLPSLAYMSRKDDVDFIGTVVESLPKSWKHLFELASV